DERAQGKNDDEDGTLCADLPVGRDAHEDEEGAGERQSERAQHGAYGRNASADEFAAAEDDAGDRIERVAVRDMGIGGSREADKRQGPEDAANGPRARNNTYR